LDSSAHAHGSNLNTACGFTMANEFIDLRSFMEICSEQQVLKSANWSCQHGRGNIRRKIGMDESPNVVTEDSLRDLLGTGYVMDVLCKQGAEKRHNSWYGSWVIRAISADGGSEKMLVTSRSVLKQREFKTIVGLVSFLADMGCKTARIPLEQGARERHIAPGRPLATA